MDCHKLKLNFFTEQLSDIEKKIRSIVKYFIQLLIVSDCKKIENLRSTIKPAKYSGMAYLQELDIDDDIKKIIFDIGYTEALLDMMQMYVETSSVKE